MHPRKCCLKLSTSNIFKLCFRKSSTCCATVNECPYLSLVGLLQRRPSFDFAFQSSQWSDVKSLPLHFSASMRLWKSGGRCARSIHFEFTRHKGFGLHHSNSGGVLLTSWMNGFQSSRSLSIQLPCKLQLRTWLVTCKVMEQAAWNARVTCVKCKCTCRFSYMDILYPP